MLQRRVTLLVTIITVSHAQQPIYHHCSVTEQRLSPGGSPSERRLVTNKQVGLRAPGPGRPQPYEEPKPVCIDKSCAPVHRA